MPRRYPGEILPGLLYLGNWDHATDTERLQVGACCMPRCCLWRLLPCTRKAFAATRVCGLQQTAEHGCTMCTAVAARRLLPACRLLHCEGHVLGSQHGLEALRHCCTDIASATARHHQGAAPHLCSVHMQEIKVNNIITIHNNPENLKPAKGFGHLQIQLADLDTETISKHFSSSFDFIEQARSKGEGESLLGWAE